YGRVPAVSAALPDVSGMLTDAQPESDRVLGGHGNRVRCLNTAHRRHPSRLDSHPAMRKPVPARVLGNGPQSLEASQLVLSKFERWPDAPRFRPGRAAPVPLENA